jgi:hypothetical protein
MLHNILNPESAPKTAGQSTLTHLSTTAQPGGLFLASRRPASATQPQATAQPSQAGSLARRYPVDLLLIATRRCSAFFAEAAVLVLVFGILDLCLLRGQLKLDWIVGALAISLGLLAASIAMDFSAQRWARACP